MPAQLDLFAEPLVPGLTYLEGVVTEPEGRDLIAHIDASGLAPFRFHQWTGKRLTASFGHSYDYGDRRLGPAPPLPEWLLPVRERAAQACGLDPADLVQALLIRYDPGAGIGWHRDKPEFEHVVGISLGNPATLRLRRREGAGFRRAALPLAPGSVYRLSGEVRGEWEHGIAPMDLPRWSITLRTLALSARPPRAPPADRA